MIVMRCLGTLFFHVVSRPLFYVLPFNFKVVEIMYLVMFAFMHIAMFKIFPSPKFHP